MAISKRMTTFEVPFGTQSTTYLEGEMEGQCEAITDYTDKSTFETEKSMLTSRFLKNLKSATIIQYTIKGRFMSR